MISFSFNGRSSEEFGIIVREVNRQLFPGVNDSYIQIPGRQGSLLYPRELQDRVIEVDCALACDTAEDLSQRVREISAWLYAEQRSQLSLSDEPDKYYMGKISQESDLESLLSFLEMGEFTLNFRCEPLAYSEKQEVDFINDSATVLNMGTYKAKPSFDIDFMGDASEIKIGKDTNYIRVIHDFEAGDKLHIADGKVLINGTRAMDKLDWQYSRFFDLSVGENVLNITPLGKCAAAVKYIPRWL